MLRWRGKLQSCHSLTLSLLHLFFLDAGFVLHAEVCFKNWKNPVPVMYISNMRVAARHVVISDPERSEGTPDFKSSVKPVLEKQGVLVSLSDKSISNMRVAAGHVKMPQVSEKSSGKNAS